MKRILTLSIVCVMFFSLAYSQRGGYKKQNNKALALLELNDNYGALQIYQKLLSKYPKDNYIKYMTAQCYVLNEVEISKAVKLLKELSENKKLKFKNKKNVLNVYYFLGRAYHMNYEFKKAIDTYNVLLDKINPKNKDLINTVKQEINYNNNALELKKNPVKFTVTNLGPEINTSANEYSPVVNIYEDILLFTRNENVKADSSKNKIKQYYEDICISEKNKDNWSKSKVLKVKDKINNATIGIVPNENEVLLYRNDGLNGDIYSAPIKNLKQIRKLPEPINSLSNDTHASFTLDGNTIYFSSNRPGGYGGKDIYSCKRLPNGKWGKPKNLGANINTELDEDAPFIHPLNNVLYFSSQKHNSIGGFDIFVANKNGKLWEKPKNLGYPINTPFDDIFYCPTVNKERAYYASGRMGGYGGSDIYVIDLPSNHPKSLAVVSGVVQKKDFSPLKNIAIEVYNSKGTLEGIYLTSKSGKFIFILPVKESYTLQINDDNFKQYKQEFSLKGRNSFVNKRLVKFLDNIVLFEKQ